MGPSGRVPPASRHAPGSPCARRGWRRAQCPPWHPELPPQAGTAAQGAGAHPPAASSSRPAGHRAKVTDGCVGRRQAGRAVPRPTSVAEACDMQMHTPPLPLTLHRCPPVASQTCRQPLQRRTFRKSSRKRAPCWRSSVSVPSCPATSSIGNTRNSFSMLASCGRRQGGSMRQRQLSSGKE